MSHLLNRHARSFLIIAVYLLLLPFAGFSESITLEEAIAGTLERSRSLQKAELSVASSLLREAEVLAGRNPSFSFTSDPVYGLVTRRIPGLEPPLVPVEPSTLIVNSASAGVSLTQPLPSTGVVSGSLQGGFSISSDLSDDGEVSNTFAFEPTLSLAISQPLFVDGKFIDVEQPRLAYEQAQRATRELEITGDLIRRREAATVVALYTQLGTLRRAYTLQNAQRELLVGQLERAQIRLSSGQASRQEGFALQVQINRLDDVRLQSSLTIEELEYELTRLTGLLFGPEIELEPVDVLNLRVDESLLDAVSGVAIEKLASDEALRRAETNLRISRKKAKATANAALSLVPRYADQRENDENLWGSVSDYFGDGAGVDIALSIGITVPLSEGAARERAIRQAEIAVDIAREDVESAADNAEYQQRLYGLRIKNLVERIELLQFELEFEKSELENELELVALGVSTDADADDIRSDILAAEIELEDLEAQLFLSRMDLAAVRGMDLSAIVTE